MTVSAVLEDAPFPALEPDLFDVPTQDRLAARATSQHRPRFLMLYGSLRERSFSRLLTFEAARLLEAMGGEVKIFDPHGLPLPDDAPDTHIKVQELRSLAQWSEGMVWTSPERHGAMTGTTLRPARPRAVRHQPPQPLHPRPPLRQLHPAAFAQGPRTVPATARRRQGLAEPPSQPTHQPASSRQ